MILEIVSLSQSSLVAQCDRICTSRNTSKPTKKETINHVTNISSFSVYMNHRSPQDLDVITKMDHLESQNESPNPQPQNQGTTTFIRTCFNGLNALSGVGILSIPYALSEGGWISLVALFVIALVCFYTALLLKRCMDSNPAIETYPDIGAAAFGKKGRAIISVFMYLELFLLSVEFLILEGDNLHKLFPNFHFSFLGGKQAFILLCVLVILPSTWLTTLSALAYVSAGGILASLILVGSVFWIGVEDVGFTENGLLWRYKGLPTAISLYTFCYCGHAIFPSLCSSMANKTQFPKVLLVCFILSTFGYTSMAIMGYLMYGENVMSQVTLNLPTKRIATKVAIYTTLINPITKYPIIISPIATTLEEMLHLRGKPTIQSMVRTALVMTTLLVALAFPFFGYVMAFIGAFMSISVSILFPCLCYLKIKKEARRFGVELVCIGVILVLGGLLAAMGTFMSVKDIVTHVRI